MHFFFGVGSRVSGMDFLEKLILSMVYSQTQGTSYSFHTHYLSLCRSIGSLEHFSFEEGRFSGIDFSLKSIFSSTRKPSYTLRRVILNEQRLVFLMTETKNS